MTDQDKKIVWYYYCKFVSKHSSFYEEHTKYIPVLERTYIYMRVSSKGWDFINSSYFEAIHVYGMDSTITKDEFKQLLTKERMSNPWKPYVRRYKWLHWIYTRHTKHTSYRRNPEHKKKVLS